MIIISQHSQGYMGPCNGQRNVETFLVVYERSKRRAEMTQGETVLLSRSKRDEKDPTIFLNTALEIPCPNMASRLKIEKKKPKHSIVDPPKRWWCHFSDIF